MKPAEYMFRFDDGYELVIRNHGYRTSRILACSARCRQGRSCMITDVWRQGRTGWDVISNDPISI